MIEADSRVVSFAGQYFHDSVEPYADKGNNQVGVPRRWKGLIPEAEADMAKNCSLPGAAHLWWIDGDPEWAGRLCEVDGLSCG